jgi:membrane fusion protein (multidrug efflux system)
MYAQLQGKQDAYTDADLQAAVAGVAQAEAAVSLAQANLDQTTVVAPFDGVVGTKSLTAGAFATPSTPILTLSSTGVEVHVTVEEAQLAQVHPGLDVQLTVPAYPGENFPAQVVTVAPSGDPRAHTFDAKIVPTNQDPRLLPGMYASVQIIAEQKPDAILVPREAVVQQGTSSIVFVNNNGKAQQRQVQTGLSDNTNIEIVSGLAPGEQVVTVGQNSLHDGTPIQVVNGAPGQGGQGGQGRGQGGQGQGGQGQGGQGQGGQGQNQGGQGGGQGGQAGQGG